MAGSKKSNIDFKRYIVRITDYFQKAWQSIVGILNLNKDYIIWVICYVVVLYPLKLIADWYLRFNPSGPDLKVWFAVLVVYFVITVLFIRPMLRNK